MSICLIFLFAFILKQTNINAFFSVIVIYAKSFGQTILGLLHAVQYFIISVL